jgi:hypothetical protein
MKGHGTHTFVFLFGVVFGARLLSLAAPGDENWDSNFGVPGADGAVLAMVVVGHTLYAGGYFTEIGGVDAYHVAQWDGTNWSPLGLGVDGPVGAIVAGGTDLYVGGSFSQAGGIPAANIAKWDGTNWSALGAGIDGPVHELAAIGKRLFAGGVFSAAGSVSATNVAMWDGMTWTNLGGGVNGPINGRVTALTADGTNLYVGGGFSYAGSIPATNIAMWNGREWSPMGRTDTFPPVAIRLKGGELFLYATDHPWSPTQPTVILHWNGSSWDHAARLLTGGIPEFTHFSEDMLLVGDDFYVCGLFAVCRNDWVDLGELCTGDLAKWDGTNFSPLGSGIDPGNWVYCLASTGSELFVGGSLGSVGGGGIPSSNIALWHIPHALSASRSENVLTLSWPATGTNFILESSHSLGQADWAEVPQTPVVIGNKLAVTNEVLSSQKFYRLRRR